MDETANQSSEEHKEASYDDALRNLSAVITKAQDKIKKQCHDGICNEAELLGFSESLFGASEKVVLLAMRDALKTTLLQSRAIDELSGDVFWALEHHVEKHLSQGEEDETYNIHDMLNKIFEIAKSKEDIEGREEFLQNRLDYITKFVWNIVAERTTRVLESAAHDKIKEVFKDPLAREQADAVIRIVNRSFASRFGMTDTYANKQY